MYWLSTSFLHPIAGGIAIAIGIGCFITGVTLFGVYTAKLKEKYKEKTEKEAEISYDNQLLSALMNLEHTTKVLDDSHTEMITHTNTFITSWNNVSYSMNSVIDNLKTVLIITYMIILRLLKWRLSILYLYGIVYIATLYN